jgi:hypothetical protein
MRVALDSATMDRLLDVVKGGGIVLYNGYFLLEFSPDMYGKDAGVWVDCSVEYKGELECSDFIKQGQTAEFLCFLPCLVLT